MPYIGKEPEHGNYQLLDALTSPGVFNASIVTFDLTTDNVALYPTSPTTMIISLGGVIQEPNTAYTISGNQITFTTAPAANTTFFGVSLGDTLDIGVPSDDSVTTAKIADDAVTYVKLQNLGTADRVLGSASTGLIGEVQIVADMIADDAVANAKLANMAANTIKVNATTGSANPTDISMTSANLSGAIADGDVLLIYDASTTSLKTVAKSVLVAGIGGTAVDGTTDNALLTFVNSNSTFAAEANLTFDGTNLTQSNSGSNSIIIKTTSNSTNAILQLETAAGSNPNGGGQIRFVQGSGTGSGNNMSYRIGYDNNSNWLYLRSLDMDGSSTDGDVFRVMDTTDDIDFLGSVGIGFGDATPERLLHVKAGDYGTGSNSWNQLFVENNGDCGILIASPTASTSRLDFGDPVHSHRFSLEQLGDTLNISMSGTDRVTFKHGGNVGIGITSPTAQLHIVQTATNEEALQIESTGTDQYAFKIYNTSYTADGDSAFITHVYQDFVMLNNTLRVGGSGAYIALEKSGEVGLGTTTPGYKFDVNGASHGSSHPTSSDKRLKTNITELSSVLSKLDNIRAVSFDWDTSNLSPERAKGYDTEAKQIGIIAQDVEAEFPELITKWQDREEGHSVDNEFRALEYGRFTSILLAAIKELKAEIDILKG